MDNNYDPLESESKDEMNVTEEGTLEENKLAQDNTEESESNVTSSEQMLSATDINELQSAAVIALEKRNRRKFRPLNFSRKLAFLCILPLILLCVIITLLSTNVLRKNLENEIQGALQIVTVSLSETYSNLYEGDYKQDLGGKLYKGETAIGSNTTLLDALKEKTGFESTFYYGDRTVITTVMRTAGGRSTGLKMDKEVYKRVQEGEDFFMTDLVIQNVEYYAYFKPLINSDGSIVGAIFAGKPSAIVQSQISEETTKIAIYASALSMLSVIVILFFSSIMSKNMVTTKNFLKVVSTGDLTQQAKIKSLKQNDELGDMYAISYSLQEELKRIVSNIMTSATELSNSSDRLMALSLNTTDSVDSLYDSVEFISKGASNQVDQTTIASTQVSNIGEQIEHISEEVTSLTKSASQMSEAEKASSNIIGELNKSNEEMILSFEKIAQQVEITNASVQEIRAAIAMIQSISDETDLLSINASIEAAHAGEAGKGFAVVAEQISKLAAQSGNNAAEIENTINTLMDESNLMVNYMDDVKVKIAGQREKLSRTIDQFSAVANGVDNSLENINSITKRMNELRKSRDVILDVISDLSAVSEEYAASTGGTIDAAQSMSDAMKTLELASRRLKQMSDNLYNELQIFKL